MKNEDFLIEGLYKIKKQDIEKCAQVAAKSFLDDNSCKYILDSNLTLKSLYEYYLVIYKAAYNKMYMFAESENINGIIIITPIKNADLSVWDCIKCGAVKLILSKGAGILFRSLAYEKICIKMRNKIVKNNSWYIFQFCVIPEKQGKKLGSKMMKHVLQWMDSNNICCYLETQKLINVDIYKHFGFSLKMIDTLPESKIKQFSMFRNYADFGKLKKISE